MRNTPAEADRLVSDPACVTTAQVYAVFFSRAMGIRNAVSVNPAAPYTAKLWFTRNTWKSKESAASGGLIWGTVQTNVGWVESVVTPAVSLRVRRVAQGGTTMGPTAPVVADAPVTDASTRQKSGAPGLNGRVG